MSLLKLSTSEAVSQKKIVLAFRYFTIEFPPLMNPSLQSNLPNTASPALQPPQERSGEPSLKILIERSYKNRVH